MATLNAGDRAPDFAVIALDSKEERLEDLLRRGPAVLAIGKSSCGTCELAFPYLERLASAYPEGDWTLLALLQDPEAAARQFARRLGLTFPIATETDPYPVSSAYDPEATPTIFLVAPDGLVVDAQGGFSKAALNRLAGELARLIGAQPVEIAPSRDGKPSFQPG